jgi:two-component system, LytTR family, response regulator
MAIRCITVDDEPFSLAKIEGFIAKVPYLALLASFSSAIEALPFIRQNPVDLIFLDIHMDNLTGIQMLEILNPKPAVILVTAYSRYALKGYELNVNDYLLKPYSFERFMTAVEKICHTVQTPLLATQAATDNDAFIFLKTEYRLEKVNFEDILYIESRGDYVYVVMKETKVLTLMTLKNISEKLPEEKFIRVHKSYVVAINKIDSLEKGRIRINDSLIPIGDTFREIVWKRLAL